MAAKKKNIKCIFGSSHANLTLPVGKDKQIEFRDFKFETTDPTEIEQLKEARNRRNPISKIVLLEEIDLDKVNEEKTPPDGDNNGEN